MKVIMYATQSVNGYLATETEETPWSGAAWRNYYKTSRGFKAMIVGRRTYQIMKRIEEFKKIGSPFTIVLSHFPAGDTGANLAYAKSPLKAMEILKENRFTKVVVAGGGKLNASFMKIGLVDELWLDIEPFVFGTGIKIFHEDFFKAKLKLLGFKKLSKDTVQLRYKVVK